MNRIRRHFILAILISLFITLGISLGRARRDDDRVVTLDVAVTDKDGNPVIGLAKHHFRLFENDVEQTITEFDASEKQLAVVLLVEFSNAFPYYGDVRSLVAGFIHSLQPKDWAALVTFEIQPDIRNDFTRDRRALLDSLGRLQMPFSRETSPYDAVYFVLEQLEEVHQKKAILLVGTGLDTVSRHSYAKTLRKAEASDSTIYSVGLAQFARATIDPYRDSGRQLGLLEADNVMRSLAEATGGLSFFPRFSGEYQDIYRTVSADVRHQYTLGYVSNNPKTTGGTLRKLRVEVTGTDVNNDGKPDKLMVRHKKGRI